MQNVQSIASSLKNVGLASASGIPRRREASSLLTLQSMLTHSSPLLFRSSAPRSHSPSAHPGAPSNARRRKTNSQASPDSALQKSTNSHTFTLQHPSLTLDPNFKSQIPNLKSPLPRSQIASPAPSDSSFNLHPSSLPLKSPSQSADKPIYRTMKLPFALLILTLPALAQPAEVNRVLRNFNFEEKQLGNLEDLPMHWNKVEGPGLPHYVNGRLATDRARSGKYSFRFDLNGGSLIYRYDAGQINVQPGAHYHIEGYVQTTPLDHARARMSAYFVDADGNRLANTLQNSDLYAAHRDDQDWQKLSIELSADNPKAAFLILELSLLQPQLYAPSTLGKQTLFSQDIRGSAWFDDITVSQVPKVKMSTQRPGNIFRQGDPLRLHVLVSDRFTEDLAAQLVVKDAAGKKVYQRSGAMDISSAEKTEGGRRIWLVLPDLPAGWYQVSLVMTTRGKYLGDQKLDLVLLADSAPLVIPDERFGVIATDLPFDGWADLPEILPLLSTGRVKLAIWNRTGDVQQYDSAAFDHLLVRLQELRITPTACLVDLPPAIADRVNARRRLAEAAQTFAGTTPKTPRADSAWPQLLNADLADWQPQLAELIARHANHLDRWQLGADGSDAFVTQKGMRQVYDKVYREFSRLMFNPDLAMPWPAWYELDGKLPITVALSVPPSVLPHQLPLYMQDIRAHEGHNLSVSLQALDQQPYGREVQIRDFAQRIVYALAADAKRIDVPLPYSVQREGGELVKQPRELFMITRTLITHLGGTTFKGKVPIAPGIEAFLFERAGHGIMVLWDRSGADESRQLAINLGEKPVSVDLWGNTSPLLSDQDTRNTGNVQLKVGAMPIILLDIDAQIAMLRSSVAIDRPLIESSFQTHTRRLRFNNPFKTAISGTVKLKAPTGWTLNPLSHSFSLNPGENFDHEFAIEFPYNSPAGAKVIEAEFVVQSDKTTTFTVPITVILGLSNVGIQTMALRDGNDVIIQQTVQNYGDTPIDYTGFAMFPGQARQERLITNLGAGRTTLKRYRFNNVKVTPGMKIRVGVKELNGSRILNDEVEIQ